ncbi:putative gag polyprotein, partial [Trifolium medium]|nr:putative gag polyprotein [Trifolium medium]
LFEPPVLSRPDDEEVLYLYLAVASEALSAVLIRETTERQKSIYFTSKALQGPEIRYQLIKKVALVLVNAARRLRHGGQDAQMVPRALRVRYLLRKQKSSKGTSPSRLRCRKTHPATPTDGADKWTIFVDGASIPTGAGAGIILENENGILIEVSLALSFPTSNNQAEYKAFLAGLRLAEDVGAKEIKIYTDSQLVASQVLGEYQAKNNNLSEYLALVREKISKFDSAEVQHVP